MGFLKKAIEFIAHPTSTRTVLALLILVAAVPLTVFVAQQQQEIRQRAEEQNNCTVTVTWPEWREGTQISLDFVSGPMVTNVTGISNDPDSPTTSYTIRFRSPGTYVFNVYGQGGPVGSPLIAENVTANAVCPSAPTATPVPSAPTPTPAQPPSPTPAKAPARCSDYDAIEKCINSQLTGGPACTWIENPLKVRTGPYCVNKPPFNATAPTPDTSCNVIRNGTEYFCATTSTCPSGSTPSADRRCFNQVCCARSAAVTTTTPPPSTPPPSSTNCPLFDKSADYRCSVDSPGPEYKRIYIEGVSSNCNANEGCWVRDLPKPPPAAPTSTPLPGSSQLALALKLDGVGILAGENPSPKRRNNRQVVVIIKNPNRAEIVKSATVNYTSTTGTFSGTVDLGIGLPTTPSIIEVKMDFLKGFAQNVTLAQGANQLPGAPLVLRVGLDDDNNFDISYYGTVFLSCFNDKPGCTNQKEADINDDGTVNEFDYNIFLRSLKSIAERQ